jgi:hypothetical protein
VDGSLYDSQILIFALAGDLAFRLSWGDNPSFIYSMGGFNSDFDTSGLDVPQMHRLSVSIGDGDNPRLSANSYIAFTSNTFQLGADVDAYASAAGFSIHGYVGFDVLIVFSPFSFEFDFYAGFDVAYQGMTLVGISVDGSFSGPRPWHLHGDASLQLLFFSVSMSVDLTWGDATPVVLPQKPVLPDLLTALQDPRNWSASLPDGSSQVVSLLQPKSGDTALRVHPLGTLTVRESVVPLDLVIQRYGSATPSDGDEFSITGVQLNGNAETTKPVTDYFAAGQFLNLSDADKLSRPSFESYHAGVKIGSSSILSGADSPRTVTYEERYVDEPTGGLSRFARLYQIPGAIHAILTFQGAGYRSPLKTTGMSKYQSAPTPGAPITVTDPQYVVAGVEDLAIRKDIFSASGGTYYNARAALAAHLTSHPEDAAMLQILPLHEALQ